MLRRRGDATTCASHSARQPPWAGCGTRRRGPTPECSRRDPAEEWRLSTQARHNNSLLTGGVGFAIRDIEKRGERLECSSAVQSLLVGQRTKLRARYYR